MKPDVCIDDLGSVPYAVIEFFALFSRLEFALLASGYVGGDVGENAWVRWDGFAKDLHKSFFASASVDAEVAVLFEGPARKLVTAKSGDCRFVDGEVPKDPVGLLLQVRTIRNNLFHGSKVNFGDRDRDLVRAGSRVLRHALHALDMAVETRKVRSAWAYADIGAQ
ncbi:hypothetical protein ACU8MI_16180 [Rhizobium leguminosarum]